MKTTTDNSQRLSANPQGSSKNMPICQVQKGNLGLLLPSSLFQDVGPPRCARLKKKKTPGRHPPMAPIKKAEGPDRLKNTHTALGFICKGRRTFRARGGHSATSRRHGEATAKALSLPQRLLLTQEIIAARTTTKWRGTEPGLVGRAEVSPTPRKIQWHKRKQDSTTLAKATTPAKRYYRKVKDAQETPAALTRKRKTKKQRVSGNKRPNPPPPVAFFQLRHTAKPPAAWQLMPLTVAHGKRAWPQATCPSMQSGTTRDLT